jgi:arylsulfatase A-like enzyme
MPRCPSALVLLLAASFTAPIAAQDRLPNIVHILADDIAWDDLSCCGARDIATPNIDRLAAAGVRLTSFYAPHSTCTPTRAAILTGCYAQRVSLPTVLFPNSKDGIAASEITIAELLQQRGYQTALIGKWHLGCDPQFLPTRHGFGTFFGIPYPNDHVPERLDANHRSRGFPPMPLYRGDDVIEQPAQLASLPERFTEAAVAFVQQHKDRPFYLHYANIETHTPWLTGRKFHNRSKAGVYGDAVQCLDWSVGRILDALETNGLTANTLVVFQSDNGPLVHEYPELEGIYGHAAAVDTSRPHALREGKYQSRYEGGCRVAGIARWPGKIAAGGVEDRMIAGFDWYATFAAAAGAMVPKDRTLDAVDVLPLLTGKSTAKAHETLWFFEGYRLVSLRHENWKYVCARGQDQQAQLYDLAQDLAEQHDVAAKNPTVLARMEQLLEQGRKELGDGKLVPADRRPAGKIL